MAKPIKKNGKWGTEVAAREAQTIYGQNDGIADVYDPGDPGGFQEYNASTQASLELASSRYGVPEDASLAAASNAKWDAQAKTNEGLRSSALSLSATYAQSAAQTRAREAESNANSIKLAEDPAVTLKKKGAVQATSAKFRI
jgi:hypothetical protein